MLAISVQFFPTALSKLPTLSACSTVSSSFSYSVFYSILFIMALVYFYMTYFIYLISSWTPFMLYSIFYPTHFFIFYCTRFSTSSPFLTSSLKSFTFSSSSSFKPIRFFSKLMLNTLNFSIWLCKLLLFSRIVYSKESFNSEILPFTLFIVDYSALAFWSRA